MNAVPTAMFETIQLDLIWMTLLVFLPAVFALGLLFFPKGSEESMRWWALVGTAGAIGVALSVLVLYNAQVLDRLGVRVDRTLRYKASLEYRVAELDFAPPTYTPEGDPVYGPPKSDDWIGRIPWVARFNIYYFLGVDGISLTLVLLTAAIFFLVVLASWSNTRFVRGYLALLLLLETGVLGTFLALDFFLFFVFWELVLVPMYFLIGIWGGPHRANAAIKFFLYTFAGSVLILLAMVALYFTNVRDFVHPDTVEYAATQLARDDPGQDPRPVKLEHARERVAINTFDLMTLGRAGRAALQYRHGETPTGVPAIVEREKALTLAREKNPEAVPSLEKDLAEAKAGLKKRLEEDWFYQPAFQYTLFWLLFLGFAIKMPIVPLHSWLGTAHVEAPTPVSMILSGSLLTLGGYGLMRVAWPICPWPAEQLAWWLALLGVVTILYGAFTALAQEDLKKLVACTSLSQMGFVLLGLAVWTTADRAAYWAWGANGALYQMAGQGITAAGLFLLVGIIAERVKHRRLDLMRGLAEPMPITAGLAAVFFFAAMGVPGLCGFLGEFMVIVGTWNFSPVLAILVILTTLLTSGYLLWTMQRIFLGTNSQFKDAKDASLIETLTGVLIAVLCVGLGVLPSLVLGWSEPSVTGLIDTLARP
jgi:NADH-quinone oxidoreductase subunit M